jgi:hypothetical protein
MRERLAKVAKTRRARVGEDESAAVALEHGQADVVFEQPDLMTDRGGRHVEFVRSERKAEMARRRFKGA